MVSPIITANEIMLFDSTRCLELTHSVVRTIPEGNTVVEKADVKNSNKMYNS